MTPADPMELLLTAPPGLEGVLADEARRADFKGVTVVPGGVAAKGDWAEVMRANLVLRGAGAVLARIGGFRAMHLAQLDKRAQKFPWHETLRPDIPLRVEATTRKSKIYHKGAAAERVAKAIQKTLGAPVVDEAALRLMVRIEDDLVTFSVDTSGMALHKRGFKQAVGKAPMRETLAALFLRQAGFDGTMPLVDPMCGSGTFVIEAAEWAAGLHPGRERRFAFEDLACFDGDVWTTLRAGQGTQTPLRFHGSDRDAGAVRSSTENAARAGLDGLTQFSNHAISDLTRPEGAPGLVMVNPPYGGRIGNKKMLFALYGALGQTLRERFSGWRVGIVTSEAGLAKATDLPLKPAGPPVPHGGIKIRLYTGGPLP